MDLTLEPLDLTIDPAMDWTLEPLDLELEPLDLTLGAE